MNHDTVQAAWILVEPSIYPFLTLERKLKEIAKKLQGVE
jgi:hypothetical protein